MFAPLRTYDQLAKQDTQLPPYRVGGRVFQKSQLQLPLNANASAESNVQRQSASRKTLMKDVMLETVSV